MLKGNKAMRRAKWAKWSVGAVFAALILGCAASDEPAREGPSPAVQAPAAPRQRGDLGQPYLGGRPLPESLSLAPPPPAQGSGAERRDAEAARAALALHGGPRWALATSDADLGRGSLGRVFSCAAGAPLGTGTTPAIDNLMRRAASDLAVSTSAVKEAYQRTRPFVSNGTPTCTPDDEAVLRTNGSYPSGHSAIGFGLGLILAEIFPERTSALVARGRAFGQSRVVCNAHWLSDVEEGRVMASATVARLHADPAFRADLEHAQQEARGLSSSAAMSSCAAEAEALSADGGGMD